MLMIGPKRAKGWRRLKQTFAKWRHDSHLHGELVNLSDRCLEDMGVNRRWTARHRRSKAFWLP
jgi:uncharacterized protein YjiS (DUF1127 family)